VTTSPRHGTVTPGDQHDDQRRRIRRNTILLVLVALGIYVAFIASSVIGAQR